MPLIISIVRCEIQRTILNWSKLYIVITISWLLTDETLFPSVMPDKILSSCHPIKLLCFSIPLRNRKNEGRETWTVIKIIHSAFLKVSLLKSQQRVIASSLQPSPGRKKKVNLARVKSSKVVYTCNMQKKKYLAFEPPPDNVSYSL
jgi:hypothetical protein